MRKILSSNISNRFRLVARSVLVVSLTSTILACFAVAPVSALSNVANLKAVQSGRGIDINWSVRGTPPVNVFIVLRSNGKIVKSINQRGSTKKVRFSSVNPGEYQVQLTSSKPKVVLSTKVIVYGAPAEINGLSVQRQGAFLNVTWDQVPISKYIPVDSVVVTYMSGSQEVTKIIPAESYTFRITDPDYSSQVSVSVSTMNKFGSSSVRTFILQADGTARVLTEPRLISQEISESVFGSFAMINRSALGPVDLSDPNLGDDTLVMKSLQGCALSKGELKAEVLGLVNIGSVLATRNVTGTMILTSGASALAKPTAIEWIDSHSDLSQCVSPVLVGQLKAVAKQLSAPAVVEGARITLVDVARIGRGSLGIKVEGNLFLNGNSSSGVSLPMELLWVVKASDSTITQYILVRAGSAIDQGMSARLLDSIMSLNS